MRVVCEKGGGQPKVPAGGAARLGRALPLLDSPKKLRSPGTSILVGLRDGVA